MNVDSIRDGIVIDHIAAGNAMKLYRLLGLDGLDVPVAMITNVVSAKLGGRISSRLTRISPWIRMSSVMWIPAPR